jgi:uncharacterized membrane protein YheB (UPF0754 family)
MSILSTLLTPLANPWFWFQPLFYSLHGWIATEMALWMLFHPYEPIFIPFTNVQLPFTPGIFPRGRKKLSVSIANTITDLLLTEQDIRKQADRLVTEENIYNVIDSLSGSIYRELQDVGHLRRVYRYMEDVLPTLSDSVVNKLAVDLADETKESEVLSLLGQLVSHILSKIQISHSQAESLARLILNDLLPPDAMRLLLIRLLSEENTYRIQQAVKKRTGGWQGVILRFFDLQGVLLKARDFMQAEPETACLLLEELSQELKLPDKLAEVIMTLPMHRLEVAHMPLVDILRHGLIQHQELVAQVLAQFSREATQALTTHLLRMDVPWQRWLPSFKRDVAHFIYTYLHRELAHLIGKALPAISLNTVIIDKIDQFSAKELEETIQRICRKELRTLAYLGAFLGFWLGLVANLISLGQKH